MKKDLIYILGAAVVLYLLTRKNIQPAAPTTYTPPFTDINGNYSYGTP